MEHIVIFFQRSQIYTISSEFLFTNATLNNGIGFRRLNYLYLGSQDKEYSCEVKNIHILILKFQMNFNMVLDFSVAQI